MRAAHRHGPRRAATLAVIGAVVAALAAAPSATAASPERARAQHVIVLLQPHHSSLTTAAVRADQAPVASAIASFGGTTTNRYHLVDALAATVPANRLAALRADPDVRAVVPDLPVRMAHPAGPGATPVAAASGPRDTTTTSLCPADPDQPQLEPEALQLIKADNENPSAHTARSLGYTGAGVTVGFIADGTDVDQPDLIRPDGSHVVVDYQDFSGDGTASATSGGEAMGDVSSIAAQGRTSYDISTFVNPSHPLPAGCTIRVEGVAPGASVVALKVFANNLLTAPTSTIVQAIDYAVTVDHVDVLNESFGSNPYPDDATDPISVANQDAIDAGTTVVASTGDAGSGNTMGTASTDPHVIGAAASTSERVYAQLGSYGYPLSNGRYTSDQVSGLSSSGIAQTTRVPDLLAPGDLNWSLCSDRLLADGTPQYVSCGDYNTGSPSNLEVFGGTSESSPLTAGASALVIEAYRAGHGGASPTPAVVRRILDSSADDLGLPADQQGSGLLDAYQAVRLARDWQRPGASGDGLSVDRTQLRNVADAGRRVTNRVTVTNQGAGVQRVSASVRAVSHVSGRQVQSVPFDPTTAPVFYDLLGRARPYAERTFRVPVGTDRLEAAASVAGDGTKYVRVSLLDPQGTFTAYSLPQGTGNYTHIGVRRPAAGTWTAIIWSAAPDASVTGPIALITTDYTATSAGTVSPANLTLPPGASRTLTVTTRVPASDARAVSLVLAHRFGAVTTVPVVDRAVQRVTTHAPARFHGVFDQANGRDFSPAQTFTYLVDVPAGARDLDVDVAVAGVPSNQIIAHLSGPDGEPVATGRNDLPGTDAGPGPSYGGLQLVHADPAPGRYQLTLELQNQSSGAALPQPFTGAISLDGADASATGIPNGATISRSHGTTATVRVVNTSPTPQTYFLDARRLYQRSYPLVAGDVAGDAPDADHPYRRTVDLPLSGDDVSPAWLVPTRSTRLTVGSSATDPVAFDVMPLDGPTTLNAPNNPDIEAVVSGRSASATHTAREIGSTQWAAFVSPVGPVAGGGTAPITATLQAAVRARAFDRTVTSGTGDPLLATVDAAAAPTTPLTLAPGATGTITVHFGPTAAAGTRIKGTLYLDIAQPFGPQGYSTLTEEVAAFPYAFTVAG